MLLSDSFLAPYRRRVDCFPNLLARVVYLGKYNRDGETWTDTIRRVVEGSAELDRGVTREEAEALFHAFWTMQALPPGRGLWTGGVPGIPAAARFNCWWVTIRSPEDWCWVADQLMLGGGVGVGLGALASLPTVERGEPSLRITCAFAHPNADEVAPDETAAGDVYAVEDSRDGWVEALRRALFAAFAGRDLTVDVTRIRARNTPIKTFGGKACGPGPLADMLRSVWRIVRGAAGRRLRSVEALDVTNFIGKCIKAGNVRRSALLVLGDPHDQEFRDAKKSEEAIHSHRHTSNNSVAFDRAGQMDGFDWLSLVRDNADFGDPGFANLYLARKTDPRVMGLNPCGEQFLEDYEACNLAEVFPARFDGSLAPSAIFKLVARYCIRQRLTPLHTPKSDAVGRRNMRVGVGLGGICDFSWDEPTLSSWFRDVRGAANEYADALGVARPITTTTVKPSGTVSLVCGSSPGIHAPYAEHYIRRIRLDRDEAIALALIEAGVPFDFARDDDRGRTLAFEFPMKAAHTRHTALTETEEDQLDRQRTVQHAWADNAVSATISFDRERPERLAAALARHAPYLKSTSFLSLAHGYAQAPLEAIDADEYARRKAAIDESHPLTRGAIEIEGCAGGACGIDNHEGV